MTKERAGDRLRGGDEKALRAHHPDTPKPRPVQKCPNCPRCPKPPLWDSGTKINAASQDLGIDGEAETFHCPRPGGMWDTVSRGAPYASTTPGLPSSTTNVFKVDTLALASRTSETARKRVVMRSGVSETDA